MSEQEKKRFAVGIDGNGVFNPRQDVLVAAMDYLKDRASEAKIRAQAALQSILLEFKRLEIVGCEVPFDGCGDSGAVDGIQMNIFGSEGRDVTVETPQELRDAVVAFAYDYLESSEVDWYNNDGGYGTLEIDTSKESASLNIEQRHTETTSYNFDMSVQEPKGEESRDTPPISQ